MGHLSEEWHVRHSFSIHRMREVYRLMYVFIGDEYYNYFMISKAKCHSCIILSKSKLPLKGKLRKVVIWNSLA